MKKLLVFAFALFLGSAFGHAAYAADSQLTNLEFAEFLQGQVGIAVPAANKNLPTQEYYDSLANALAASGINNFQNTPFGAGVDFAEVVDVVYALAGAKGELTTEQKADFLLKNGFFSEKINASSPITLATLQEIFGNPKLAGLIAEAYTEPAALPGTQPGLAAPGMIAEEPASRI